MKKFYLVFLALVLLFIPTTYSVAVYQLDQPIKELNNHSLREVFEASLVNNEDWIPINSLNQIVNDNLLNTGDGTNATPNTLKVVTGLNTNNIYLVSRLRVTNPNATLIFLRTGDGVNSVTLNTPIQNQYYMPSLVGNFSTNTIRIDHRYVDASTANNKTMEIDYVYAVNRTSLGITSLTIEQMDSYFKLYLEAVRFENENIEASQDPGGYQNIFKSVIDGVKNLIVEMGNVWQFLNAPIITSEMSDYSFSIDWSWDLIGVVRQLINSLAILILQTNFIFINLLFSFTGIPVQISILSMIFSNFVFVILGWIIVKSFII